MKRWNPNFYLKTGREEGYAEDYLGKLVQFGRALSNKDRPVVFTLSHLAKRSNVLYSDLHAVVSRGQIAQFPENYKNFTIKKRSGGRRWISVPAPPLMACQSWITQNILNNVRPSDAASAYVPGRKIQEHSVMHCGSDWVLKIDLRNFFEHISERQVYRVFFELGYPALLSFEMARICTRITPGRFGKRWKNIQSDHEGYHNPYVGSLPQGAPSSPPLSNLVFRDIDEEIQNIAEDFGVNYNRYADDLTFSAVNGSRESLATLKKYISKVLYRNGFSVNENKTRIIPPGKRKVVGGLVVNGDRPSIPREVRDKIKMHLHFCEKFGIYDHCVRREFKSVIGFRNHLQGLISYVNSVDPDKGDAFLKRFNALPWVDFDF